MTDEEKRNYNSFQAKLSPVLILMRCAIGCWAYRPADMEPVLSANPNAMVDGDFLLFAHAHLQKIKASLKADGLPFALVEQIAKAPKGGALSLPKGAEVERLTQGSLIE